MYRKRITPRCTFLSNYDYVARQTLLIYSSLINLILHFLVKFDTIDDPVVGYLKVDILKTETAPQEGKIETVKQLQCCKIYRAYYTMYTI